MQALARFPPCRVRARSRQAAPAPHTRALDCRRSARLGSLAPPKSRRCDVLGSNPALPDVTRPRSRPPTSGYGPELARAHREPALGTPRASARGESEMESSASTPPSSSTAASASAPATPASVEQLDKGQVSGPLGRGGRKRGGRGLVRLGVRVRVPRPRGRPRSFGRVAGSRCAQPAGSFLRAGRCLSPPSPAACPLLPQVDCRRSLGFRGEIHLALLPHR